MYGKISIALDNCVNNSKGQNGGDVWDHLGLFRLIGYVTKPRVGQIIIKTDQNDDALCLCPTKEGKNEKLWRRERGEEVK